MFFFYIYVFPEESFLGGKGFVVAYRYFASLRLPQVFLSLYLFSREPERCVLFSSLGRDFF